MGEVFEINRKRFFNLEEARALIPTLRRMTDATFYEVEALSQRIELVKDPEIKKWLSVQMETVLDHWDTKIKKLGCETKGLWLVDFDNGEGYFCWHYPEPALCHFHGYDEGFKGRKKIQ